jgi:hypothetical protein
MIRGEYRLYRNVILISRDLLCSIAFGSVTKPTVHNNNGAVVRPLAQFG